jgi:UDP-N-acetyl-D-galactosamine dehydrogenase
MYEDLIDKSKTCPDWLGYVGLPIATGILRKIGCGFDINAKRIEMMKNGIDPSNELVEEDFEGDITLRIH